MKFKKLLHAVARHDREMRSHDKWFHFHYSGLEHFDTDNQIALQNWLNSVKFKQSEHYVLHFNRWLKKCKDANKIEVHLNQLLNRVSKKAFSRNSKNRVRVKHSIENLSNANATHLHLIVEVPEHLNRHKLRSIFKIACSETNIGSITKENEKYSPEVFYERGLIGYISKDIPMIDNERVSSVLGVNYSV
jgi:hypothetical protein